MNLAYLYSLVWIFFLLFLLRDRREYMVYIYIVSLWTFSSLASIVYGTELQLLDDLRVMPYAFLFVCLLVSFYPFYRNDKSINGITIGNWKMFKYVIVGLGVISVLPFLENLIHVLTTYNSSNSDAISDLYDEKMSGDFDRANYINWFSLPGRIGNSINLKFQNCSLFLLFIYLCTKENNKKIILLLLVSALNPVLYQLNMSGRSSMVWFFLMSVLLFFIFYGFIQKKTRTLIVKVGLVALAAGVFLISILTLARYDNNAGANSISILAWVSLYIGEGSLNFNNDMWDIKVLTEGDNCFSFFKNILGFDTFTDYLERREYWGPKTGINPVRFYTFIGDIFSDIYFFVLPLVFTISVFLRRLINKSSSPSLFTLYLYFTWGCLCLTGVTCYTLKTYQSMIDMTVSLIVIALISSKQNNSGGYIINSNESDI